MCNLKNDKIESWNADRGWYVDIGMFWNWMYWLCNCDYFELRKQIGRMVVEPKRCLNHIWKNRKSEEEEVMTCK